MQPLDDTDRRLLRLLQENCDLPVADLAARAGLSAGACWRRLERLERDGVILGRRIEIDFYIRRRSPVLYIPLTLKVVKRHSRSRHLHAIDQERIIVYADKPAPGALAYKLADPRFAE